MLISILMRRCAYLLLAVVLTALPSVDAIRGRRCKISRRGSWTWPKGLATCSDHADFHFYHGFSAIVCSNHTFFMSSRGWVDPNACFTACRPCLEFAFKKGADAMKCTLMESPQYMCSLALSPKMWNETRDHECTRRLNEYNPDGTEVKNNCQLRDQTDDDLEPAFWRNGKAIPRPSGPQNSEQKENLKDCALGDVASKQDGNWIGDRVSGCEEHAGGGGLQILH